MQGCRCLYVLVVHGCPWERVRAAVRVCSAAVCMHGCACACSSPLQGSSGTSHMKIISRSARAWVTFFISPSEAVVSIEAGLPLAEPMACRHEMLPWSKLVPIVQKCV